MPKQRSSANAGDEELPPEQIFCKKQACDIQICLARRNLQESACRAYIETWEQCRDKVRAKGAATMKKNKSKVDG